MNWFKECFNTKGRWNRKKFWLYPMGFSLLTYIPILIILFGGMSLTGGESPILTSVIFGIVAIWYILIIYVSVLSYIKRLRDLDKNPWMSILGFVPLVNIAFLIYWGFWKGTPGENKYGPDPLGGTAPMKVKSESTETKITTKTEEL